MHFISRHHRCRRVGHNGLSYDRIDLNTIKDLLGLNPVSAPGGPGPAGLGGNGRVSPI